MTASAPEGLVLFKRLAAIHRTVTASLDFEEALGLIAGSGFELVGAASCLVLLRDENEVLRVCAAQGVDPATAGRFIGSMEESVLGDLGRHLGIAEPRAVAATPIMNDHVVQGVLVVIRAAPLTHDETWLLSALADQASITLKNAHHHELAISREAELRVEVDRSRKLAREVEASIESVARDLRAPLQDMTGGEPPTDPDGIREHLIRVASGARKMEALIQDLLSYSTLGDSELNLEAVELEGPVLEALARVEPEMKSRGGLVRVESPLYSGLAHRETLVSILVKLLSHAIGSVNPGQTPLVEVGAEHLGTVVRVSVRTRGLAFGSPGTSIGLAIVRRGMERMSGRCGAEAEPGRGSRFWIELRGA